MEHWPLHTEYKDQNCNQKQMKSVLVNKYLFILDDVFTSLKIILLLQFFFFQAEDDIRGGRVTGVQTCALPISVTDWAPPAPSARFCVSTASPATHTGHGP